MVFGLAGRSVWASIRLLRSSGGQGRADFGSVRLHVRDSRPVAVIILALMLGWWIQMVYAGRAEQVLVHGRALSKTPAAPWYANHSRGCSSPPQSRVIACFISVCRSCPFISSTGA